MKVPKWFKKVYVKFGKNIDEIAIYAGSSSLGGLCGWTEASSTSKHWEPLVAMAGVAAGVLTMKYGPTLLDKLIKTYRKWEEELYEK
jgi:hypothetical protein